MDGRLSITDVAKYIGVTSRTIMRWEKSGKIKRSKRDWRGWRFYTKEDLEEVRKFYETVYEYDEEGGTMLNAIKSLIVFALITGLLGICIICSPAYATTDNFAKTQGIKETSTRVDIVLEELPAAETPPLTVEEAVKYTLGPNDVIAIDVRRHPEFSGQYKVNSEGKIEYKYVGDIIVSGLTKKQLNERLTKLLSEYIIEPDINIQIVAYLSKVFYVVGDVNHPGKFYMRGDAIKVREALVQAGLPNQAAAMRRCRIITPDEAGKENYIDVNVYRLLYEGDLKENKIMKPGDVLYVPATIMAKIIRVIAPVTSAVGEATGLAVKGAAAAAL